MTSSLQISQSKVLTLFFVLLGLLRSAAVAGTWAPVALPAPGPVGLMLLLPDGTVMVQNSGTMGRAASVSTAWYRLTPAKNGNYVSGTWSTLSPMHDTRRFGSSQVMPNGNVFVAGGEYGSGRSSAEVYDPLLDQWTFAPFPDQEFSDSISELLPDGRVLVAPVTPHTPKGTVIYDGTANTWTAGPACIGRQDEAAWVKLPDNSILTIDTGSRNSERYIPSENQWVADSNVPVTLYDSLTELGAAFLLSNGQVFFLGGTGETALYTPSGDTSPGTWTAGPDVPNDQGTTDAPAAMLNTGNILCAVGPAGSKNSPTNFYEFNPSGTGSNSFIQEPTVTGSADTIIPDFTVMLDLPDGTVLCSQFENQLYVYTPSGSPLPAGKPAINSITPIGGGSYQLVGTLLDGISEGAAFGDDLQMSTNRPIVRLTDIPDDGIVYYARTYNWSSTAVMTGTNPLSTDFALPPGLLSGTYSVIVSANGNSSDPVTLVAPSTPPFAPDRHIMATGTSQIPIDVLTYDLTASGSLSITGVTTPANGQAISTGTSIDYTPAKAFAKSGTDAFTYTISNGQIAATGTISIINPYRGSDGTYTGLVTDEGGDPVDVGYIIVTTTKTGSFSGKLHYLGLTMNLHGAFDSTGAYSHQFNTAVGNVTVTLYLDYPRDAADPDNYKIIGNIVGTSDQSIVSTLREKNYTSPRIRAPAAGIYSLALPAANPSDNTVPAHTGTGTLTVGGSGATNLIGHLGDGTPFSAGTHLRSGDLSTDPVSVGLFSSLPYHDAYGSLSGSIAFEQLSITSDCDGLLTWFKSSSDFEQSFRNGFYTRLRATASLVSP